MRLPSIDQLIADASASVRRFPYVILAATFSALIPMSWLDGAADLLAVLTRSGTDDGYKVTGVAATWLVNVVVEDAPVAADSAATASP